MRVIGLDIHRVFVEVVLVESGAIRRLCRVGMTRDHPAAFAKTLTHDDHIVVGATGNASAVAKVIRPDPAPCRPGGNRQPAPCSAHRERRESRSM